MKRPLSPPAHAGPHSRRRWLLRAPGLASKPGFAAGLALSLCTLGACALSVPGFVLGAEAPDLTSAEPTVEVIALEPELATDELPTATNAEAPSSGVVFATLPWGDGPGQVGLVTLTEGLGRGPEAVAAAPNGRIVVLDSVNKRLVLLDASGSILGHLPIDLAEPRFLAVTDRQLFVLDCDADRRLVALDWDGSTIANIQLPELNDAVTALLASKQGPCIEVAHAETYLIDLNKSTRDGSPKVRELHGRPLDADATRSARATFSPGKKLGLTMASSDTKNGRTSVGPAMRPDFAPGRAVEHVVSLDGDGTGGLIVGARLRVADGEAPLLVTRLRSATARPSESLLLDESLYTYLGQPYVVTPDARIIQPVADETGYHLLVHTFSGAKEAQP